MNKYLLTLGLFATKCIICFLHLLNTLHTPFSQFNDGVLRAYTHPYMYGMYRAFIVHVAGRVLGAPVVSRVVQIIQSWQSFTTPPS